MKINLIRLHTFLDDRKDIILKENDNFIEEINNELVNDDICLVTGDKEAKVSVFFIETGGCEAKFVEMFDNITSPVFLISNGKNNSLPATLEIKTYCNSRKKPAIEVCGDELVVADALRRYTRIMDAKVSLDNNNIGVIGEPSEWLISSRVDNETIKKTYNLNIIDIKMDELYREIDSSKDIDPNVFKQFRGKFDSEELSKALNVYASIKNLVKKYNLQALTIRCFDLIKEYKTTACLALAMLNKEGITCSCEGDVPSLLTMHFINRITGLSSFQANPSYINKVKKTVLFAHCTIPLNMISDYELDTHFESGLGVAVKGNMRLTSVSVLKAFVNPCGKELEPLFATGDIIENNNLKGYCRTQITVKFNDFDFMNLMTKDFGNHLIITYGDIIDDFISLWSLYHVGENL